MADPARNAAIYYADDGYNTAAAGGINGRRVAGSSFLEGFFRYAEAHEFVSVSSSQKEAQAFAARLRASGRTEPHRNIARHATARMAPVGTLYYPAGNIADECWKRQISGAASYAICGVTHTTATQAIMRGFFSMRAGPQMPWDALICTSHAVHAATLRNIELADDHLRYRFGAAAPRPLMPVIPLGIDTAAFAHDPAARAALRSRMGWTATDVAVVTLARLLPYGKFDPGPLFIALQAAQMQLKGHRLHFIACGAYADDHSRKVFTDCAAALMPDVPYHHLDGTDATARRETLSGGDIFTFPIDNVQETFGLAPVEAMAAGLPTVGSDWDGLRDTVVPEVGILVPTRTVRAAATRPEAEGYLGGRLNYAQYGNNLSALTALDVGRMTQAFVTLAEDAGLRHRMGHAGLARARALYDWAAIIPQYQDLWQEQTRLRSDHLRRGHIASGANPIGPLPMDLFASYPSDAPGLSGQLTVAADGTLARLDTILTARRYAGIGHPFEQRRTIAAILSRILDAGPDGTSVTHISRDTGYNSLTVERAAMFLLKYALITFTQSYR